MRTERSRAGVVLALGMLALACGDNADALDDAGNASASSDSSSSSGHSGAGSNSSTLPSTDSGRDAGVSAGGGGGSDAGGSAGGGGGRDAGSSGAHTRDAGDAAQSSADGGSQAVPGSDAAQPSSDAGTRPDAVWKPKAGTSWQWDLGGKITKLDVAADVYDIDGFENDAAIVEQLHRMGKKVICYLSVGTYEPGRPDAGDFPKAALGKYWAEWDETYIDIRSEAVRAIMQKRLDMCQSKGFDGIEPDNMDMFEGGMSDTGFPLTRADGIAYAKWLAEQAHARGLSIGQKNASSITSDIEAVYDWALTEDCFADKWCGDMKRYTDHDKAMFMCEYTDTKVDFAAACTAGKASKFSPILKKRALDSWIEFCAKP